MNFNHHKYDIGIPILSYQFVGTLNIVYITLKKPRK